MLIETVERAVTAFAQGTTLYTALTTWNPKQPAAHCCSPKCLNYLLLLSTMHHRLAVKTVPNVTIACLQAFAVLGNVMSLVGGMCSMCCSLLLPSLFYLILYKHELSLTRKCSVILLLLCGIALLLLIVVQNLQDLLTSHHAPIPYQVSTRCVAANITTLQLQFHLCLHATLCLSLTPSVPAVA